MRLMYKLLAFLLIGFAGGCISPWVVSWIKGVSVTTTGDAISIANTYIVFTTIIFVGFTVVLGVAGYVFTQHFSASKEMQENQIVSDLKLKIKNDEKMGITILQSLLDNADVKSQLSDILEWKIDELLNARLSDSEKLASQTAQEAEVIRNLSSKLKNENKQIE